MALFPSTSRVLGRTAGHLHLPALGTACVEPSESSPTHCGASCVPLKVCVGTGAGQGVLHQSFLCFTSCKHNTFSSCLGFLSPAHCLCLTPLFFHAFCHSHFYLLLPFLFFFSSACIAPECSHAATGEIPKQSTSPLKKGCVLPCQLNYCVPLRMPRPSGRGEQRQL